MGTTQKKSKKRVKCSHHETFNGQRKGKSTISRKRNGWNAEFIQQCQSTVISFIVAALYKAINLLSIVPIFHKDFIEGSIQIIYNSICNKLN